MEEKIIRNVLIESINTVVSNVEIVSITETMIQFKISVKQYEIIEDALISIGANIQVSVSGKIFVLINKRKSDFSIVKSNNSTYNNVCDSIKNLEYIKENNNILFNNPGISSTEKMTQDYIILALEYLTRAKECLRDLHYDK